MVGSGGGVSSMLFGLMGLRESPGIDMFSDALRDELVTIADVPVIEMARSAA